VVLLYVSRGMTTREATQTVGLALLVGILCGCLSALFLALLERATALREAQPMLVLLLPLLGVVMGRVLSRHGAEVRAGTGLVLQTARGESEASLPWRVAPLVMCGTLLTHLCGGSAGREGTAVQMGASAADSLARAAIVPEQVRRALLIAGMAGGFGSVFGTPLAGAVFGLEVLLFRAPLVCAVPALVAALVGDRVTLALGIVHTPYPQVAPLTLELGLLAKWGVVALCVALTCVLFIESTRALKALLARALPDLSQRMFVAGALLVALSFLPGAHSYLGLGVPTILRAFADPELPHYAFLAKLGFTALTLSAGFLGGEVTPLFFVGATLGNALAVPLQLPLALCAGVCMSALFGAAANTPIALSVMAIELLGSAVAPHVLLVSALAYLATGRRSIYAGQIAS
jgi:H+/Cl- antiporter ClcA